MADAAAFVDVAFAVEGDALPRDHRRALAAALERTLPWLADEPGAAVHRLNVAAGGDGGEALMSRRTRLTLRLPRGRASDAAALQGAALAVGPGTLRVGAAQVRELQPWGTLYAHLVVAEDADELAFLRAVREALAALGVEGRAICGRRQAIECGAVEGYSLMLDGLSAADALRLMQAGLGAHRRLGCGVFVPHRSASAVGAPP
jgi:CRISPR-associated protein Cas6